MQEKQLGVNFAFGLAPEGQHANDWNLHRQGKGGGLTQFDYEVRGFEIEGIAAKARGVGKFPTAGNTVADELLWNSSWRPADVDTLRRNGAMYSVTARNYKDPAGKPLTKTNTGWKWK